MKWYVKCYGYAGAGPAWYAGRSCNHLVGVHGVALWHRGSYRGITDPFNSSKEAHAARRAHSLNRHNCVVVRVGRKRKPYRPVAIGSLHGPTTSARISPLRAPVVTEGMRVEYSVSDYASGTVESIRPAARSCTVRLDDGRIMAMQLDANGEIANKAFWRPSL